MFSGKEEEEEAASCSQVRTKAARLHLCVLFLIVYVAFIPGVDGVSIWKCPPVEYHRNDSAAHNAIASRTLIRWITARQYSCSKKKEVDTVMKESGCMGHLLSQAQSRLLSALEMDVMYRPTAIFRWAEAQQNCTYGQRYIDCYTEPISPCFRRGVETPMEHNKLVSATTGYSLKEAISNFSTKPLDTCGIAKMSEKSLQWVSGQVYLYLLRLRKDIQAEVDTIVQNITNKYNPQNESFMTVQLRGGNPDGGRVVGYINPKKVNSHIQRMADDILNKTGKPVTLVYLASDHPADTYVSIEAMANYSSRFEYVDMHHLELSKGEVEYALKKADMSTRRRLAVEFYADLWLYSLADGYIGSTSNIYYVVSSIRAALSSGIREHTCQLRNIENYGLQFWCERSKEMMNHLRELTGGYLHRWEFE